MASWDHWSAFWATLESFVRVLNEHAIGTPYEINIGSVRGDGEMVIKSFRQSRHFEALLQRGTSEVQAACLAVSSA